VDRRDGPHFGCATWLREAREMPKEDFRRKVEEDLTGKEGFRQGHDPRCAVLYFSKVPMSIRDSLLT
jgi:hypothetical protein